MSLLRRVCNVDDRAAWAEFLAVYEPLVYRLARRRGLQDADAREVTQEVLITVSEAIEGWEPTAGRGSFRSWLLRIARNLAINFLVKQQRHPRGSGDTDMQRFLADQPTPGDPDTVVFDQEYRRQLLRLAAEKIKPLFLDKTWSAFWRTCVEGESIRRVAIELEMPVGSVYAARSRIMARLSDEVRALMPGEEE